MRKLLPRKPPQPPRPPVFCREGHDVIKPPLWFNIFPIAAGDWDPITNLRPVEIIVQVQDPYAPPAAHLTLLSYAVVPPHPTTITNLSVTQHTISQLKSKPVMQFDLLYLGQLHGVQFKKPPHHSF